jgi:hypothetical protein
MITAVISLANALYYTSEESTKIFVIIINCLYYFIKFIILMIKIERDGIIYNKFHDLYILTPSSLGLLCAVFLGLYVQSPVLTINFINVGLEASKFIVLLIVRLA